MDLQEILNYNKAQEEIGRELELIECPDCAWELKVNSQGVKACPICGRIWNE
jgi:predicted RNA-binding Zn-ribbon protein involved in translation (DUF1610 family)